MKHIVGVGDMKVIAGMSDVLVTHALGSCLGVIVHDPQAHVAGLLHAMLPSSEVNPEKAKNKPCMFVDTGVPALFRMAYNAGADKKRLVVKVAGGAMFGDNSEFFAIGKRNFTMLRKLLWANSIMIAASDVGGSISRTLYFDTASGRTWIHSGGQEWDL